MKAITESKKKTENDGKEEKCEERSEEKNQTTKKKFERKKSERKTFEKKRKDKRKRQTRGRMLRMATRWKEWSMRPHEGQATIWACATKNREAPIERRVGVEGLAARHEAPALHEQSEKQAVEQSRAERGTR